MEHPAPVYPTPGGSGKVGKTLFGPLDQAQLALNSLRSGIAAARPLVITRRAGQWAMPTKVRHRFWWVRESALRRA